MFMSKKIKMIIGVSTCSFCILGMAGISANDMYQNTDKPITVNVSSNYINRPLAKTISENSKNKKKEKTEYVLSENFDKIEIISTKIPEN